MARRLRYVPPGGALVEVTCRTVQGRMLLRPSAPLSEITRGVLARAARLYAVAVHGHSFVSNHYHVLVSVLDARQLAAFMNYLNSNLAREAGRLVRWREKFWGRRYQAIMVSDEEEAQVSRLAYLLAHGVKEGLVDSPYDWPGAHCARELVEGKPVSGRWRDRTLESRSRRKGLFLDPKDLIVQEQLTLAPLPCWRSLEPAVYRARIQSLIAEIEAWGRQRQEETGRPPLGRDKVCGGDPHLELNRIKKAPAPLVHAVAPEVRRALRRAYFSFLAAYQRAARSPPAPRRHEGCRVPRRSLPPSPPGAIRRPQRLGLERKRARAPDPFGNSVGLAAIGLPGMRSYEFRVDSPLHVAGPAAHQGPRLPSFERAHEPELETTTSPRPKWTPHSREVS